jgi:putative transposase
VVLERRKRAERALTSVVATCYLLGVSTRRMDKLVASMGITSLSKSQVSQMAKELDAADALVLKGREGGRVVPVHALVATGVNADGHREILGVQVTTSEDGAGWLAFFRDLTARDLTARGLCGVRLVTSCIRSLRAPVRRRAGTCVPGSTRTGSGLPTLHPWRCR